MPRGRPKKVQMIPEADIPIGIPVGSGPDVNWEKRMFIREFIFECIRKHPSLPSPEALAQITDRAKTAAELVYG